MTPPPGPAEEPLPPLLKALRDACAPKKVPNRFHARAVLLELGHQLLAGESARASKLATAVRAITATRPAEWAAAVDEELRMACTEHVQSVDPRFLARPDYDLAYVVEARADLEARLRAAEELDLEAPEALLARVIAADERLAPHLRDR